MAPTTIVKIEVFRVPPRWVFVRVETSEGIVGWGEGTLEGHTEAIEGAFKDLVERFVAAVSWIDNPSILDDTVTRVKGVRSLGIDVGVDFHGRLHKGMAKQLSRLLEPHQPLFIEEPLLPTQPEEIADLARAVSTPIALGERLYTRSDFRPYLEKRAIDIAQPDVSHCGGISELHRIAALTETYDVALAPHCPLGPIALAACMQIAISAPNSTLVVIQEMSLNIHYNVSPDPTYSSDLYTYLVNTDVFKVIDGHVAALNGSPR
ncbi:hypothetical protein C0993_003372 [Termitomyces sp. T159_Od127]|nr:hypothetical protein C0993_003372 [Termitomyces sp. T159_Od127]